MEDSTTDVRDEQRIEGGHVTSVCFRELNEGRDIDKMSCEERIEERVYVNCNAECWAQWRRVGTHLSCTEEAREG
jgi:hypothetical protein